MGPNYELIMSWIMFMFVKIMFVFHIPSMLVKNMTDKVILGIPFIFILYPYKVELDGVSIVKMGVPIKFHFASRFEIDVS